MRAPNLSIEVGGVMLKNPVLTAAGTVGFGSSYADFFPLSRLGGLVLKSLTLQPCTGNPRPRLWETPSGLLNSIGFENRGLKAFTERFYPNLAKLDTPLIASIYGGDREEFRTLAQELSALPKISALEVNLFISWQHYRELGAKGYLKWAASVVAAVREAASIPVWVKLSPDAGDPLEVVRIMEAEGAAALTVSNSYWAMALDPETRRSRLGTLHGCLSGPAIKPLALHRVWEIVQITQLPVIGVGGILTAADALEFFLAGASAVGIGTGNFVDPETAIKVIEGIEDYLVRHGFQDIKELQGALGND